jgi:hypothetical protein
MLTEAQLTGLLLISALIWFFELAQKGIPLSINNIEPISTVVTILLILLKVFDKWLWKIKIFFPWFVDRPNLQGTWKGTTLSNWENPNSEKLKSIPSFLVIKQSYSSINSSLFTEESRSDLISGKINKKPDGTFQFIGVYLNYPDLLRRQKSSMHHGAFVLHFDGNPPSKLKGEYWTERNTSGELDFLERKNELIYDYSIATDRFNKNSLGKKNSE